MRGKCIKCDRCGFEAHKLNGFPSTIEQLAESFGWKIYSGRVWNHLCRVCLYQMGSSSKPDPARIQAINELSKIFELLADTFEEAKSMVESGAYQRCMEVLLHEVMAELNEPPSESGEAP